MHPCAMESFGYFIFVESKYVRARLFVLSSMPVRAVMVFIFECMLVRARVFILENVLAKARLLFILEIGALVLF